MNIGDFNFLVDWACSAVFENFFIATFGLSLKLFSTSKVSSQLICFKTQYLQNKTKQLSRVLVTLIVMNRCLNGLSSSDNVLILTQGHLT